MLKRLLAVIAGVFLALIAGAAAAQIERYAGTARIADQAPMPVHVEFRVEGAAVTGEFTIAGGVYKATGDVVGDVVTGRYAGDGGGGVFTLKRSQDGAVGSFDVEGAPGVFDLRRTTADAKAALAPPPQKLDLTADQWRQDLDELVRILTEEHGAPFHRIPRAAFEAEVARVRADLPYLSGPEAAVALRRLSMLIGDGHTGVGLPAGQPRYPLRTFWFADGLRVVETTPEHQRLLGARVEAIEGVSFGVVADRLRPYSPLGENAWSWRAVLPFLVHRPEVLRNAGVDRESPSAWTFRLADGRTERVSFTAAAFPLKGRIRLGSQPVLWEQRAREPFWTDYRPSSDTLYVNFRSYDALPANAAALAKELDIRRPRRLVIDMRDNGGGDYNLGRTYLLPVITSRPWLNRRDRTFVLVGRHTFSAAMSNAADFRWGTNVTLVGEPVGENPNSWQESRRFHLPNSGLPVTVSTKTSGRSRTGVTGRTATTPLSRLSRERQAGEHEEGGASLPSLTPVSQSSRSTSEPGLERPFLTQSGPSEGSLSGGVSRRPNSHEPVCKPLKARVPEKRAAERLRYRPSMPYSPVAGRRRARGAAFTAMATR